VGDDLAQAFSFTLEALTFHFLTLLKETAKVDLYVDYLFIALYIQPKFFRYFTDLFSCVQVSRLFK
jgi:hypothetical protein